MASQYQQSKFKCPHWLSRLAPFVSKPTSSISLLSPYTPQFLCCTYRQWTPQSLGYSPPDSHSSWKIPIFSLFGFYICSFLSLEFTSPSSLHTESAAMSPLWWHLPYSPKQVENLVLDSPNLHLNINKYIELDVFWLQITRSYTFLITIGVPRTQNTPLNFFTE